MPNHVRSRAVNKCCCIFGTVNPEIFARILFLRIEIKLSASALACFVISEKNCFNVDFFLNNDFNALCYFWIISHLF